MTQEQIFADPEAALDTIIDEYRDQEADDEGLPLTGSDDEVVDDNVLAELVNVFRQVVTESHPAVIDGWSLDLDGFEERLRAAIQKPGLLPLAADVERQIGSRFLPGAPSDPVAAVRQRPVSLRVPERD